MKKMHLRKCVWYAMTLHLAAIMVYPHAKPARHFSSEQFKVKSFFYRYIIIVGRHVLLLLRQCGTSKIYNF